LRHVNGSPQQAQILLGRFSFFTPFGITLSFFSLPAHSVSVPQTTGAPDA